MKKRFTHLLWRFGFFLFFAGRGVSSPIGLSDILQIATQKHRFPRPDFRFISIALERSGWWAYLLFLRRIEFGNSFF